MELFTLIIAVLIVVAVITCKILKVNGLNKWEKEVNDTLESFIDFSAKHNGEELSKLRDEIIDDLATVILKNSPKYLQQIYTYEDIKKFISRAWENLKQ